MCGRIEYVVESKEVIEGRYGARFVDGHTERGFINARYNVPPSAHTPIIPLEDVEHLVEGAWGYKPSWAAKSSTAHAVINARVESVFEKPYFKSAILARRCIIPVTGFFEWHREEKRKVPYRFHMNNEIFSLGGIYTILPDAAGIEMPHYAILTTSASELMAPVHDRMPVVLDPADEATWLNEGLDESEIAEFFKPNDTDRLQKYEISTLVNSPKNDTPSIREPVTA